PASGPVGASVVITGTNLTGVSAVQFSGVTATFTVNSNTQITATVPSGAATGFITLGNGASTSATTFFVTQTIGDQTVTVQPVDSGIVLATSSWTYVNSTVAGSISAGIV